MDLILNESVASSVPNHLPCVTLGNSPSKLEDHGLCNEKNPDELVLDSFASFSRGRQNDAQLRLGHDKFVSALQVSEPIDYEHMENDIKV